MWLLNSIVLILSCSLEFLHKKLWYFWSVLWKPSFRNIFLKSPPKEIAWLLNCTNMSLTSCWILRVSRMQSFKNFAFLFGPWLNLGSASILSGLNYFLEPFVYERKWLTGLNPLPPMIGIADIFWWNLEIYGKKTWETGFSHQNYVLLRNKIDMRWSHMRSLGG